MALLVLLAAFAAVAWLAWSIGADWSLVSGRDGSSIRSRIDDTCSCGAEVTFEGLGSSVAADHQAWLFAHAACRGGGGA